MHVVSRDGPMTPCPVTDQQYMSCHVILQYVLTTVAAKPRSDSYAVNVLTITTLNDKIAEVSQFNVVQVKHVTANIIYNRAQNLALTSLSVESFIFIHNHNFSILSVGYPLCK